MTIRDTAIAKLEQLSEALLPEVSDFIDSINRKHQAQMVDNHPKEAIVKTWLQWFEAVGSDTEVVEKLNTLPVVRYSRV